MFTYFGVFKKPKAFSPQSCMLYLRWKEKGRKPTHNKHQLVLELTFMKITPDYQHKASQSTHWSRFCRLKIAPVRSQLLLLNKWRAKIHRPVLRQSSPPKAHNRWTVLLKCKLTVGFSLIKEFTHSWLEIPSHVIQTRSRSKVSCWRRFLRGIHVLVTVRKRD